VNPFIPNSPERGSRNFQQVVQAFLGGEGLPFANVLSAERIERIFAKHHCVFGLHGIYSTAVVVWAFLSQVLRDKKEAACQSAVANVVSYRLSQGLKPPSEDTGDYCRARAKLSEAALHEVSNEVAEELEQAADARWLWKDKHHAKLIDGFTFTMPDTPKNQAKYPQQKAQKPGVGLPIARAVAMVSLATACVMDLAIGPYKGKETGEPALLRSMLRSLAPGDIAVMDRYYLFLHDDRLVAVARHTRVCSQASSTPFELSPRPAAGQMGSHNRLDSSAATEVDGRRNVRADSRTIGAARDSFPRHRARSSHENARHHHDTDRCRPIHEGRHCGTIWISLELGIGYPKH
jgi:hypothetical protein